MVCQRSIQRLFKKSQLQQRILRGEFGCEYLHDAELKSPSATQGPLGTRSQVLRYFDDRGQWIVEVHRYLKPDNSLGASGMPDPKRLRIGDMVYVVRIKNAGGSYMDEVRDRVKDSIETLTGVRQIVTVESGPLTESQTKLEDRMNQLLSRGWVILSVFKSAIDAEGETITIVLGHTDPNADPTLAGASSPRQLPPSA